MLSILNSVVRMKEEAVRMKKKLEGDMKIQLRQVNCQTVKTRNMLRVGDGSLIQYSCSQKAAKPAARVVCKLNLPNMIDAIWVTYQTN